ncbi:dihydrolipoyllysine-residue succinyltransferase component of 2-oxoglutarate dehydrogenase complex [Catalinimonas niigatensis]|uniref:hypothetical protein n=1 Tax=Catalinimonas niigatensis TaxID=1397264 RepID=UPI0026669800|nr:hypothetical protein [Catalinimonas niigatensis]WPP48877.1 hypothetical protein PZB72_19600 [Catalinimonas niigatensis]
MDELIQIALFVLFALFSLGSNLLNKRKKQQAETRKNTEQTEEDTLRPSRRREVSPPDAPEERERQPLSFEDILRELTGESPRAQKQEKQEEIEDDYEHPFSPNKPKQAVEKVQQKAEQKSESFGKSVERAKEAKRITDKISIDDKPLETKLVVETRKSRKNKQLARNIAASLKDGQGARKAIILSEIINRKHF